MDLVIFLVAAGAALVLYAAAASAVLLAADHEDRGDELLARPRGLVVTLTLVKEVAAVACGVTLAVALHAADLESLAPVWLAVSLGAVAFFGLGEVVLAERLARPGGWWQAVWMDAARPLVRAVAPVRRSLVGAARAIVAAVSPHAPPAHGLLEREGVERGGREAAIDAIARALLERARVFRLRPVGEIMTPRVSVVSLPATISGTELLRAIQATPFSRIPVHGASKDDIVGIVYVKDLLGADLADPAFHLEGRWRRPSFVPATNRAPDVFRAFRRDKVHVALVVDEFGAVAGLVTMEDLLEELFGEIRDEFDAAEPCVEVRGANRFVVPGRMDVHEFEREFGVAVPAAGGATTVGGVVIAQLGRLPACGEAVEMDGYTLTAEQVAGAALEKVGVRLWTAGRRSSDS